MRSICASVIALIVTLAVMAFLPKQSVTKAETELVAIDCEGNACEQVTVTWDDTKQQYKVQNNSTDQSLRVDAENLAATASVCVPPGKTDYLSLKSIVGSYRANYQQTCANPQ